VHNSIINLTTINKELKLKFKEDLIPNIIAVSKNFKLPDILPLIEFGHIHFGENKVQEAIDKWSKVKLENNKIQLHLIGKLQTNKVKFAVEIFDYIHSLDSIKLAKKISDEQTKKSKRIKIFIQVNLGNEIQKAGVSVNGLKELYNYSLNLNLDIIGLMCIPPANENPQQYFNKMKFLSNNLGLKELSMGMSADYIQAVENNSTFIRVGSSIFGQRS
jgi:PLP dependent protein